VLESHGNNIQVACSSLGLSYEDANNLSLAIRIFSSLPISNSLLNLQPKLPAYSPQSFNPHFSLSYPFPGVPMPVPVPDGISTTTLYVRNLPLSVPEDEIRSVFENYGNVRDIRFQKDQEGNFRGHVFVEYKHESAAKLANIQLSEKQWNGRTIKCSFATEKKKTPNDASLAPSMNPSAPIQSPPSSSIYVSNLPTDCDKNLLISLFARFGDITGARPLNTPINTKGIGFVDFVLLESAQAAIDALDNTTYNGKIIRVNYAALKKKRQQEDLLDTIAKRSRIEGVPEYPGELVQMGGQPGFGNFTQ